jgi:hypothetical protein
VTQWLGRNRFGALLPNFRNYNGRDLLRLTRDDIIAMCGVSDGIRLYNDLHLVSVPKNGLRKKRGFDFFMFP